MDDDAATVEAPPLLRRYRLTVDDYYRMADVGLLAPDARVELIEGEIIEMAPMRSRHAGVVTDLMRRLQAAVGEHAVVTCQIPLRLSDRSEPEPDLMLLRPRSDLYKRSHPSGADVLLAIEVADTSLRYDLEIKVPLYARHGVAQVWVVDLAAQRVVAHRALGGAGDADVVAHERPTALTLPDGSSLPLGALFDT